MNKRPTGLYGHLRHQRLYTDFFSEGFIFAYQQPHHIINKIKTVSKTHLGNTRHPYIGQRSRSYKGRIYTACCLKVIHPFARIWYAYVKEQKRFCQTQINGDNIILKLRSKVKVIQR